MQTSLLGKYAISLNALISAVRSLLDHVWILDFATRSRPRVFVFIPLAFKVVFAQI